MTPDEVQNEIDDFNENARQEAQECFSEQIGREMAFSCQRFKTIADNCTEALENLKPFAALHCALLSLTLCSISKRLWGLRGGSR